MMKTRMIVCMGSIAAGLVVPAVQGWSYNPEFFTIAEEGGGGMAMMIVGNFAIWQDSMGMQWFGYDLAKRESFPIVTGMQNMPMINESYMVWPDNSGMNWNAFELATRRRFSLAISDADSMSMRLAGHFLVYRGMMDMILHGMDLASGVKFDITSTDIDSSSIRAAGDYAIWRTMTMPSVLAGYQLSTRTEFVLSNTEMIDSISMVINERFAAWLEMPAEPTEAGLFGFDLVKREKFLVTREFIDPMSMKISGNFIIGQNMSSQALFGFDGVARQLFEMAAGNVDAMSLALNERYAIWRDTMSMHICGFDLATRRLISTSAETPYAPVLAKSYFFWNIQIQDIENPEIMINELRGFDLVTGTEFIVTPLSQMATYSPVAGGDYVVWSDMNMDLTLSYIMGARIRQVSNDRCEEAAPLTAGVTFLGDSTWATGTDQTECGLEDWRDIWHQFRPARSGEYTINAHSDAFDTTLGMFESCTGAETGCNDDATMKTTDSQLVVTLVKAKTYYFRVAGVGGSGGPYALTVSAGSCAKSLEADLTGDCRVNLEDFAEFSAQWLDCGLTPAELCEP